MTQPAKRPGRGGARAGAGRKPTGRAKPHRLGFAASDSERAATVAALEPHETIDALMRVAWAAELERRKSGVSG